MTDTPTSTPTGTPTSVPASTAADPPAARLPTIPRAEPLRTWPTILVEGPAGHRGSREVALAMADDERVGEIFWLDWASGLGAEWVHGTRVELLERALPLENWERQLAMFDKIAEYARSHLDTTGKPIALIIDSMSALWAEQRRWARAETNRVPKNRHTLRQFPGIRVPIENNLWDELDDRTTHLLQATNSIPGITVLLANGSLKLTDSEGVKLTLPDYRVDAHKLVVPRVHAHLRVDDIDPPTHPVTDATDITAVETTAAGAYPIRVPPICRDVVDPKTPVSIPSLVFDLYQLDPKNARHHTGLII